MLNGLLVAWVSVPEVALRVYPVPALSIFRFANVATPFTAFTGALPVNVPPAGLLSMAIATAPVKLVIGCAAGWGTVKVTVVAVSTPNYVVIRFTTNDRLDVGVGWHTLDFAG